MSAIKVNNVFKQYADVVAVDNISFEVKPGELYGLIGPDGAGKTTLFRILTTLLLADQGTASVLNYDVVKDFKAIRNIVGYMPGRFSLYQDLSVKENLTFFATVFGTSIEENYDLIKDIYEQIKPFNDRRAGKLSGGMKQKLALCCALIHKPEVLFLDEPTTGVDVVSRKEFWDMLAILKAKGITILVSTPYMDEAIRCDRIALMQSGRIMSIDTPENIISAFPNKLFAVKAHKIYELLQRLDAEEAVASCYAFGEYLHVTMKSHEVTEESIFQLIQGANFKDIVVRQIEPTIEDSFMYLMKENECSR